ncbi:caspase family protein [Marinoscillum sp. MHG1-6]|uniref:caspase family protein n=1 Tax=Marinoscillum sp. MHG1-6 TaxID=2959627 RepID=UPI0021573C15|nr:caspase family protein [Marinoscillum sp. MHG1-6]
MKSLLLSVFLSIASVAFSQSLLQVSGKWVGTSKAMMTTYQISADISQKGNLLEGYVITKSMDGRDSVRMNVSGAVNEKEIILVGSEIVYHTIPTCLSSLHLEYVKADGVISMIGYWKGDWSLKTCPPGSKGDVILYLDKPIRNDDLVVLEERNASRPGEMEMGLDDLGNVLVNELSQRKFYSLIIGIDEYPDAEIESLDRPVSDALNLAAVLKKHYTFEEEQMIILKNPKRAQIIESLDELAERVGEKDNLLIFYAGHGIWNEQLGQGYWLPSDASMQSRSQWLSNSTIRDYVGGIRSKHTLLISDACFSGGILKERAVMEHSKAILELYKLPSRKAMTSGTMTTVPDQSVFMQYLLKNLSMNEQPLISSDELFRKFKIAVINNSSDGQVPQYGAIAQTGDEGGDFVFLKRAYRVTE